MQNWAPFILLVTLPYRQATTISEYVNWELLKALTKEIRCC